MDEGRALGLVWFGFSTASTGKVLRWGELLPLTAQELTDSHKANIFPFDFHPEKKK